MPKRYRTIRANPLESPSTTASAQYALAKQPGVAPVVAIQRIKADRAASIGCVNKAALADANMINTPAGTKEHQVAGRQSVAGEFRRLDTGDLTGCPRQIQLGSIAVDESDQSGTIESSRRGIATVSVRRTDQTDCPEQHRVGQRRIGRWPDILDRLAAAAATGEQQQ